MTKLNKGRWILAGFGNAILDSSDPIFLKLITLVACPLLAASNSFNNSAIVLQSLFLFVNALIIFVATKGTFRDIKLKNFMFVFLSGVAVGTGNALYFLSVSFIGGQYTELFAATLPIVVAISNFLVFKKKITIFQQIGFVVTVGLLILLILLKGGDGSTNWIGVPIIFGAILLWVVQGLLLQVGLGGINTSHSLLVREMGSVISVILIYTPIASKTFGYSFSSVFENFNLIFSQVILPIVILAWAIKYSLSIFLYQYVVKSKDATHALFMNGTRSIFAPILLISMPFMGTDIIWEFWVIAPFIVIGIWMVILKNPPKRFSNLFGLGRRSKDKK